MSAASVVHSNARSRGVIAMSSKSKTGLTSQIYEFTRSYADHIVAMPDGKFTRRDLDDSLRQLIDGLIENDVLVRAGRETVEDRRGSHLLYKYRVRERARDVAENIVQNRNAICPCGHGGVSNHGDYYTCAFEACDRHYGRDELEEGQ